MRHFIFLNNIKIKELHRILNLSATIKSELKNGERTPYLAGKMLAMIFEKPSLRTRVSFETGMFQLGGSAMFLGSEAGSIGKRESVKDFSEVLSSMVDVIMFRAMKHRSVTDLAKYSSCPVINGLTDLSHPCQALADIMTIRENFGELKNLKLAWVGDANNVAVSLVQAAAKFGMKVSVAAPDAFQFDDKKLRKELGKEVDSAFEIELTDNPVKAVQDAHIVATDVWVSMGQEAEEERRKHVFAAYQVNGKLMKKARKDAIFLHCLPAKRGQEVTDEVIDSEQSKIVQEAENRLHAQKGLLVWLLNEANR
ncbi:ornithine carbamoyltransferase [Planctomycetales bacterium]|nr:ornithine carbamoyltransferase [Planctomycetales bacterium]GHT37822.1 ornithine carbamoyltransferase [Planctomycetales bacterium]